MARQRIPTKQAPRDAKQYLDQLEQLLKRNTGSGTFVGQDTSSNIPMYIPGRVANPTGLGETPSTMAYGNGMQAPMPVERQEDLVYEEPPAEDQPLDAETFLQQFEDAYSQINPQAPGTTTGNPGEMATGVENTPDGGVLFSDGIIYYNDGTFRAGDSNAYGIASDVSGGTRYSDGSIRMSYEQIGLPKETVPGEAGLGGLIKGIFGQERTITQDYGNYNPGRGYAAGRHRGTDIRTRDLTGDDRNFKLPVDAEVVQVLYAGGGQPYGNSVLLKLPSGEMLRFSHMSQMANLQNGDRLSAGEVFGMPGSTGNSDAEHLDLEYFNQAGQVGDPNQFSGFTNAQSLAQPKLFSSQDDPQAPVVEQPQAQFSQPVEQPQQMPTPATDLVRETSRIAQNPLTALPQETQGQIDTGIATVGQKFGIPEVQASEVFSGKATPGEALSRNIETFAPKTPIDTGISEALRGDFAGAKTNFMDTASRVGDRLAKLPGQIGQEIVKPAYADDGSQKSIPESIAQNLSGAAQSVDSYAQNKLSQAGEGVKALGQKGISALEGVFAPKIDEEKRAVGDVKGTAEADGQAGQFSSIMDTAQSMANLPKNDVRDSFFKMGGSEMYKQYLKPDAENLYGGALTLDLFNNDFFKDLGNISSVFGGSKDLGTATEKYVDFEKQKYQPMQKMNWEEGYDRGQVDDYNRQVDQYNNELNNYFNSIRSSVKGSQSIFTPAPMSSSKNIFSSSKPAMSMSATPMSFASPSFSSANMSIGKPAISQASRPQMSVAPNMSVGRPSVSAPAQQSNKPGSSAPQMSVAPRMSVAPKAAPQMSKAPVMSVAPKQSAPRSTGTQSKPSSNVFSRVSSAIKSIFRR